jgi:phosphopantetheine--protein transferase-like protein
VLSNSLTEKIERGVFAFIDTGDAGALSLLAGLYMGYGEMLTAETFSSESRRSEYLISRIALKDAVRDFVYQSQCELLSPTEIVCTHDERGKPLVSGLGEAARPLKGIHVSLAHKKTVAVAMASDVPVGIDLERIEEKSEGFERIVFTDSERELLACLKRPEGVIRFWVAKEACAKKAGTGLEGNPKRFEVTSTDGDVLSVGDERIRTRLLREEYVVGWTL